ncbi:response regulator [Leptolyngbya sp. FACHB-541]|uniref:response regulator n=1 Tax=Leptolyngbya sp. FACHB-541 TaxID=2692810 RepID=UPI001684711B|nr:response regulator [Leptolyngbya sp. FACHB-541]MBD1995270.1 response regulator [Leptolyngbya sp. FACHB-541]
MKRNIPPFELLLVEDDPMQVKLMELQLKSIKSECFTASTNLSVVRDGVAAQDYLYQALERQVPRPDLILLDLNMPRMGGQKFLEWLRNESDFRLKCIPVVVLSTSRNQEEALNAYRQQIAAFVPKPTDITALRSILESMQQLWVKFSLKLPDVED